MAAGTKHISKTKDIRPFLKAKGMRATSQRLAVHEAMLDLGHACADQVSEYIEQHGQTRITTSSVYNILSQFSDLGLYARRFTLDNRLLFDINTEAHLHLYDSRGHVVKDVYDSNLMEIVTSYARKHRFVGYKLDSVEIQLVCHPKRKRKKV